MTNRSLLSGLLTSICHGSFVIGHLTEDPCQAVKNFHVSSTDEHGAPMLDRLGRYVIESEIGKGGMGVVYRARDERLGKIVAVKVLLDSETVGPEARLRLRREAQAAAILNHPAIAGAYDYDEQNGTP